MRPCQSSDDVKDVSLPLSDCNGDQWLILRSNDYLKIYCKCRVVYRLVYNTTCDKLKKLKFDHFSFNYRYKIKVSISEFAVIPKGENI